MKGTENTERSIQMLKIKKCKWVKKMKQVNGIKWRLLNGRMKSENTGTVLETCTTNIVEEQNWYECYKCWSPRKKW